MKETTDRVQRKQSKINLPTKITIIRIYMIPLIIACFCLQKMWDYMFLVTVGLFIVASATDFVDGYIARKYNMVTALGKFLDPIADKVLVVAGFFMIVEGGYINIPNLAMICSIIILAREFAIGLFRQIAALQNNVLAADRLGKYKTIFTMIGVTFLMFYPIIDIGNNMIEPDVVAFGIVLNYIGLAFFILATILTVVSGINYIAKNKQVFAYKK